MERFKILNDLEVLDTQTGLIWRRDYREGMTWQGAMEYAASLGNGWRLPTRDELEMLINPDRERPASDFPDMPGTRFWSSSSNVYYSGFAWVVYFVYGSANYDCKASAYDARCVRDGESDGTV